MQSFYNNRISFDPSFAVSTFAAPPMVHSPVFVSAAPDGALYVSSDPNGSVGTTPGLGKIVRLRDTNGDEIADEALDFAKVDAPRGLVAHGRTVFVLHPPHLSAFTDNDGDGIADEQKILVRNIGWDYSQRRADHASNGLELGIDGWLYAAIGDFGFLKAEGTDGRTLQLRGGGVVRVRQDGTGLELYSAGTRNILEAAISPLLDGFARDNTNDGGGWDTRFHHFSGLEDHGYPRLYKNGFSDGAVFQWTRPTKGVKSNSSLMRRGGAAPTRSVRKEQVPVIYEIKNLGLNHRWNVDVLVQLIGGESSCSAKD